MGYTKRPGEGIGSKILKTTEDLERLADVSPEAPHLDKTTKKDYRKKSEPLAANIATIDQVTSKDAEGAQSQLHLNALGLQDSIEAAYLERLKTANAESLELIAQGKPPVTELTDKQLRTVYVLNQDTLSREEAHALRLLEPLMTPPQREKYLKVRQADYTKERSAPTFSETVKLGTEVVSPFLLPAGAIPLGHALGLSGSPLTIAIAITATIGMTTAEYMQKHAMGSRSSALYGVNVLENPNTGNDLLRLRKRAEETAELPPDKRNLDRLQSDLAVFEELLAMRKEKLGAKEDAPEVVAFFERHAADLQVAIEAMQGGAKKVPADFGNKEHVFLEATRRANLEVHSANIGPIGQISEADFRKGMNVVVDALVKQMLRESNPGLERTLARIDTQYGISKALTKGEKVPALPPHEIAALRELASKQSNFPEALGLGTLAIAGAIDIGQIWPDDKLRVSSQETIDLRALLKDIEKMRFGAEGDRLQMLGKIVDYGSQGVSIGAMSLVLLLGGGFFSIPAALIPRILGVVAGNKLKQQGLELEAAQGIDFAKGRPMANEFEVLLDRYRNPGALFAGDAAAVKAQLKSEAELVQTLMESIGFELSHMSQEEEASWQRYRLPVYTALVNFANELGGMVAADVNADKLRAGVQAARQKLFAPEVLRSASQQMIRDAAYLDAEEDPFVKYCTAKLGMLDQVEKIVSSRTESFGDVVRGWDKIGVRNTEIFRQATELRDLRQKIEAERSKGVLNWIKKKLGLYKGPELDPVDKLAMSIIEDRFKTSSLSAIVDVVRVTDDVKTKLSKDLQDRWPVDDKRAAEIGKELIEAVLNRTMATVGPWTYENVPKVEIVTTAEKISEDPPKWSVKGTIGGGRGGAGTLDVTVLAAGICDPNSIKFDLGEALLGRVARAAIESSAAMEQAKVDVTKTELLGRDKKVDGDYNFRVTTKSGAFTVAVTPDGFARLDTITNVA